MILPGSNIYHVLVAEYYRFHMLNTVSWKREAGDILTGGKTKKQIWEWVGKNDLMEIKKEAKSIMNS